MRILALMGDGNGINSNNSIIQNMVSAIIEIAIGFVIWEYVPGWITQGKKKVRDVIKLACNIVGIIIVLFGCYSLLMSFVSLLKL